MSDLTCPCDTPLDGATLCNRCVKTLAWAVANVGAYHADLDTLRARQTRYSVGGGKVTTSGRERPLPVDLRFADQAGRVAVLELDTRRTVVAWTRRLLVEFPPVCEDRRCRTRWHLQRRTPRESVQAQCGYLLGWVDRMRTHVDGPRMLAEFTRLENQLRPLIDRPAERWFAGICSADLGYGDDLGYWCPEQLYADTGAADIVCRSCGARWDVQTRRDHLLAHAEEILATAAETARAVTAWSDYDRGEARLVRRISDWRDRGRIQVKGHVEQLGRERPLYRIGDVLDLLVEDARHADKHPRRAS